MKDQKNPQLETLQLINLQIRQQLEIAEAKIPAVNQQIASLHAVAQLPAMTIPGPLVGCHPYGDAAESSDRGQVLQAVLKVPDGIGLVRWDSEDRERDLPPESLVKELSARFVLFDVCTSTEKAKLLAAVEELVGQVLACIDREYRLAANWFATHLIPATPSTEGLPPGDDPAKREDSSSA